MRDAYLRCAYFIEHNEHNSLHEPCKDQILLSPAEKEAQTECEPHLRYEARQGRAKNLIPQR
jgi:hypothetical protein